MLKYMNNLEEEHGLLKNELGAVGEAILNYMKESNLTEQEFPDTISAMKKLSPLLQDRVERLDQLFSVRLEVMKGIHDLLADWTVETAGAPHRTSQ